MAAPPDFVWSDSRCSRTRPVVLIKSASIIEDEFVVLQHVCTYIIDVCRVAFVFIEAPLWRRGSQSSLFHEQFGSKNTSMIKSLGS